jgi:hypothetical protein
MGGSSNNSCHQKNFVPLSFSPHDDFSGKSRIRTYDEINQQIYSLSPSTTQPSSQKTENSSMLENKDGKCQSKLPWFYQTSKMMIKKAFLRKFFGIKPRKFDFLEYRQVARHRFLTPIFKGSNPFTPIQRINQS